MRRAHPTDQSMPQQGVQLVHRLAPVGVVQNRLLQEAALAIGPEGRLGQTLLPAQVMALEEVLDGAVLRGEAQLGEEVVEGVVASGFHGLLRRGALAISIAGSLNSRAPKAPYSLVVKGTLKKATCVFNAQFNWHRISHKHQTSLRGIRQNHLK